METLLPGSFFVENVECIFFKVVGKAWNMEVSVLDSSTLDFRTATGLSVVCSEKEKATNRQGVG